MIAGIGTDIADVRRFEKWVKNPEMSTMPSHPILNMSMPRRIIPD